MPRAESVRVSSVQHELAIAACLRGQVPVLVLVQQLTAPSLMVSVLTVVRDFHRNQVTRYCRAMLLRPVTKWCENGSTGWVCFLSLFFDGCASSTESLQDTLEKWLNHVGTKTSQPG